MMMTGQPTWIHFSAVQAAAPWLSFTIAAAFGPCPTRIFYCVPHTTMQCTTRRPEQQRVEVCKRNVRPLTWHCICHRNLSLAGWLAGPIRSIYANASVVDYLFSITILHAVEHWAYSRYRQPKNNPGFAMLNSFRFLFASRRAAFYGNFIFLAHLTTRQSQEEQQQRERGS